MHRTPDCGLAARHARSAAESTIRDYPQSDHELELTHESIKQMSGQTDWDDEKSQVGNAAIWSFLVSNPITYHIQWVKRRG